MQLPFTSQFLSPGQKVLVAFHWLCASCSSWEYERAATDCMSPLLIADRQKETRPGKEEGRRAHAIKDAVAIEPEPEKRLRGIEATASETL